MSFALVSRRRIKIGGVDDGRENSLVLVGVGCGLFLEFSQNIFLAVVFVKGDAVLHFEGHAILGNLHRITNEFDEPPL